MARFVKFPGTAGSYASTDDVNLLDADTAHLQQSLGKWAANGPMDLVLSSDLLPQFGDTEGKATATGAWSTTAGGPRASGNVVSAGTGYTFSSSVASADALIMVRLRIDWRDSVDGAISTDTTPYVEMTTANQWFIVAGSFTAPALAAFANVTLNYRRIDAAAVNTGDVVYWDAVCNSEGTSATFVPSLRIVGDLDVRQRLTSVDWANVNKTSFTHHSTAAGASGWYTRFDADGRIRLFYSLDGATSPSAIFANPNLVNSQVYDIRTTRTAATGDSQLFVGGVSQEIVAGTLGAMFANASDVNVGRFRTNGNNQEWLGDIYTAEVRDGIDGPIVAVFDADDIVI